MIFYESVSFLELLKGVTFVFQNKDPHSPRIIINDGKKIRTSPMSKRLGRTPKV